jgi:hypothetical protein
MGMAGKIEMMQQSQRVGKGDIARQLAERIETDEETGANWLDAVTETLYENIAAGGSVTLPGFGGFYVRPGRTTWVFRFNPSQRLRSALGWSYTYKGD